MKIEHVRIYTTKGSGTSPGYTISHIYVDGVYVCDSVEDYDRGLDQSMSETEIRRKKVKHQTAIPTGTYTLTMNVKSPKFSLKPYYQKYCKGYVPRLLNVKGFDGILIHCGSSADSSSGCVIVGYNKIKGRVLDSKIAWEKLMRQHLMPAKVLGENITYIVTRKYKV